jgi:tetrapyrrole methylase family protein / MazG family protein
MEFSDLKDLITLLEIKEIDNLSIIDFHQKFHANSFYPSPNSHTFISFNTEEGRFSPIFGILQNSFRVIEGIEYLVRTEKTWIKSETFDEIEELKCKQKGPFFVYIPPQEDKIDTSLFIELIAHLRSADGCPWDKKQTHKTLRTNLLEETYEVLEAIDQDDKIHLREELGDLLLQIVLHAQIAKDEGAFDYGNVVHDVYWKIRNRHPHVFQDSKVNDVSDVMTNWEKIKAKERQINKDSDGQSILASIPDQLPALSIAQKFQERAARVGFDWEDIMPVYEKVMEEMQEVKEAQGSVELESELGDLLFAVVNLVRWSGFDAETALRLSNKKFRQRFQYIERKVSDNGQSLTDLSLSEMDDLWDQAKFEGN